MFLLYLCHLLSGQLYVYQISPRLIIMEGGYAVEEIGINTVNVLIGFEGH